MTTERPFRQMCDSCTRMRTTTPSRALNGGWRSFADWWMCPTCVKKEAAHREATS